MTGIYLFYRHHEADIWLNDTSDSILIMAINMSNVSFIYCRAVAVFNWITHPGSKRIEIHWSGSRKRATNTHIHTHTPTARVERFRFATWMARIVVLYLIFIVLKVEPEPVGMVRRETLFAPCLIFHHFNGWPYRPPLNSSIPPSIWPKRIISFVRPTDIGLAGLTGQFSIREHQYARPLARCVALPLFVLSFWWCNMCISGGNGNGMWRPGSLNYKMLTQMHDTRTDLHEPCYMLAAGGWLNDSTDKKSIGMSLR